MPTFPTSHWDRIAAYLAASREPVDPAALYALSAPEALLIIGSFFKKPSEIDVETYTRMLGQFIELLPPGGVGPAFEAMTLLAWKPDETGGSALVRLRELRSGLDCTAVFRLEGDGGLIYGAYLSEGLPDDPALVKAQILAELAHWAPEAGFPYWPVTALGLSFFRLCLPMNRPFEALPEARFTCQGRGECCSVKRWRIFMNQNAQTAMRDVDWAALGEPGPEFEVPDHVHFGGGTVALVGDDDGRCKSLTGSACGLHKALGWQPLDPCMQFPFGFVVTPDAVTVTAAFTCATVAKNQGQLFTEQSENLRQRFQPRLTKVLQLGDWVPLTLDGPQMAWPAYRWVEARLLDVLADDAQSMADRLRRGSRHVAGLLAGAGDAGGRLDLDTVKALWEKPIELPPPLATISDEMAAWLFADEKSRPDLAALDAAALQALLPAAWREGAGWLTDEELDGAMLTRYLRTMLFRKFGAERVGLACAWGILPWLFLLWHRETRYRSQRHQVPVDHDLQIQTVKHLEMWHLHSHKSHQAMVTPGPFADRIVQPATWASLLP